MEDFHKLSIEFWMQLTYKNQSFENISFVSLLLYFCVSM